MDRFRRLVSLIVGVLMVSTLGAFALPHEAGDANAGAALVQSSGCAGCHGAQLRGGSGPKLVGIERRRTSVQIANAIVNPVAPMPKFDFDRRQVADIVAYLSQLDGGASNAAMKPRISILPANPTDSATVRVWFPGTPPRDATVQATMSMGHSMMGTDRIKLRPSSDPHVLSAKVPLGMGGAWMIKVHYGKSGEVDIPINVGS